MLNWVAKYIYAVEFNIHSAMMRHKLRQLQHHFSGKLVDIGAGDQPYRHLFKSVTQYLATNTRRHYGDKTAEMESFTDVWIDDASQLPFADGEMDGIICFQVLSVVQKPELFFKEARRVLKPGGRLLLTTDFLYPSWSEEDRGRYSVQQLKRMATKAGLEITSAESFGGMKSLAFALTGRRIRSYPENIRAAKSMLGKVWRSLCFIAYLLMLPLISLAGMVIFISDRKNTNDYNFTFNLMLLAQKPEGKAS